MGKAPGPELEPENSSPEKGRGVILEYPATGHFASLRMCPRDERALSFGVAREPTRLGATWRDQRSTYFGGTTLLPEGRADCHAIMRHAPASFLQTER